MWKELKIIGARVYEPEDFDAAIFLVSEAADYVHGEIITVDGGWMGR